MLAFFNGQILPESSLSFPLTDRGFAYGDGLFESMICHRGQVRLLRYHIERALRGLYILGLRPSLPCTEDAWAGACKALADANHLEGCARIKCLIWRKEGGLYAPTQQEAHVALLVSPWAPLPPRQLKAGIARTVSIQGNTPLSGFKKIAALPYVLAGLEARQRGLDDMLLLSNEGHICETVSSNVFWVKKGQVYTPSLRTGCLPGVMRRHFMESFAQKGLEVMEVEAGENAFETAESLFITNVGGFHHIISLESAKFDIFADAETLMHHLYQN